MFSEDRYILPFSLPIYEGYMKSIIFMKWGFDFTFSRGLTVKGLTFSHVGEGDRNSYKNMFFLRQNAPAIFKRGVAGRKFQKLGTKRISHVRCVVGREIFSKKFSAKPGTDLQCVVGTENFSKKFSDFFRNTSLVSIRECKEQSTERRHTPCKFN